MKVLSRSILVLALILNLAFVGARAQNIANEQAEQELVEITQRLLSAVAVGDSAIWNTYLSDSCLITSEDGQRKTKAELVSEIRSLPAGYIGRIKVTSPKVFVHGNMAVISCVDSEFLELHGQKIITAYCETDTYIKTSDGWRMVSYQVFEKPDNPPAVTVNSGILQRYAGTYELAKGIEYTVTVESGKLFGQRSGRKKEELRAETETVFFRQGERGAKLFVKDAFGSVAKMIDRRNGHDVVWLRMK